MSNKYLFTALNSIALILNFASAAQAEPTKWETYSRDWITDSSPLLPGQQAAAEPAKPTVQTDRQQAPTPETKPQPAPAPQAAVDAKGCPPWVCR